MLSREDFFMIKQMRHQGAYIVATVNRPDDRPWMFHIAPKLHQALIARGPHFASESLLAQEPQVVFVAKDNGDGAAFRQAGLPVMEMRFTDYPSLKHSLTTTAQVIGSEQALTRAREYNQYLQSIIDNVGQKTVSLIYNERPRVLHIQSLKPLKVDGSHTLIDTWIRLAGGRNVAQEINGNMQEVSQEKVLACQPDIIILGPGSGNWKTSPWARLFTSLNAVKNGQVFFHGIVMAPKAHCKFSGRLSCFIRSALSMLIW